MKTMNTAINITHRKLAIINQLLTEDWKDDSTFRLILQRMKNRYEMELELNGLPHLKEMIAANEYFQAIYRSELK